LKGIYAKVWKTILLLIPLAVISVLSVNSFRYAGTAYPAMEEFLKVIETYSNPGERVSFISTSVYPKYPTLVYADRLPGTRFMSAFPIALIYSDVEASDSMDFNYRSFSDMAGEELQFLTELGEDIQANRPALVFIDAETGLQACPAGFVTYDYLAGSGWLEKYMTDYRFLLTCRGFRAYRLN